MGDTSPRVFVRAANGTGKTMHAAAKLAKRAVTSKIRGRWVGPTRALVRDVAARYLWGLLREYCAPGCYYKPGVGFNRNNTIVLKNGSEIQLKSYQDEPTAHEGDEFDVVVLDEPPPQAHYDANESRVGRSEERKGGQLIVIFTAVNRPTTWFREKVEGKEPSPTGANGVSRTEHESGWVQYVVPYRYEYVCMWQSREQCDHYVRSKQGTMQFPQRIEAAWEGTVDGRKLRSFDEHCLVTRESLAGRAFDEYRLGIDHGTGVGKQVAILVGVLRDGHLDPTYYLLSEYVGAGGTTPEQDAREILLMIKDMGLSVFDITRAFGDIGLGGRHEGTRGGGRWNDKIEVAIARLLRTSRSPITIEVPYKKARAPDAGEASINHACAEGRLYVNRDNCPAFIRSAMTYEGAGARNQEHLKDPIDAFRYAIQDLLLGEHAELIDDWDAW